MSPQFILFGMTLKKHLLIKAYTGIIIILSQNQTKSILNDPTIGPLSQLLDKITEQIHTYSPDSQEVANTKAQRLRDRVVTYIRDHDHFFLSAEKSEGKAKQLNSTCQFLATELENLSLEGIDFTQQNMGINRNSLETKLIEISDFLSKLSLEKEKQSSNIKAQASELTKTLTLNALPNLSGPLDWLIWYTKYKSLAQHYSSDLAKQSLIRSSLTKKVDRDRIDNLNTSNEMLQFLMRKYGDIEILIPQMLNKLKSLPKADNKKQLVENYNFFTRTLTLLQSNSLIHRLDRYLIDILIPRLLLIDQQSLYFSQCIEKESEWRLSANLPPQIDLSQNCLSSNSQFEELKRNHFLKFTNNAYETVRRLLYSSQFQENSDYKQTYGRQRFFNKRNAYFSNHTDKKTCHFCNVDHGNDISKCPNLARLSVIDRVNKIKKFKDICKRCLSKVDYNNHNIVNGRCPSQKLNDKCSKCGNFNHHSWLCLKTGSKIPKQRGNQFKREPRKQRISHSAKVSFTSPNQIIDEFNTLNICMANPDDQTGFQNRGIHFVTNVGIAQIQGTNKTLNTPIFFDTGSCFSFTRIDTVKSLNYKPIGHWEGFLSTLNSNSKVRLPVYNLRLIDIYGKIVTIPALGLEKIAFKDPLDNNVFNEIVNNTQFHRNQFHNVRGEISLMIGLRSSRFMPGTSSYLLASTDNIQI